MKIETAITIGYVALQHEENVLIGDTRKEWRRRTKIVPLTIRSMETEDIFIEPVEEIVLGKFSVHAVTPAISTASNAIVPHLEEPEQLEIDFHPVQSLGLVRTRENELAFADLGDDVVMLPKDTVLVGVVPAPAGTFSVNVYDGATDEEFKLGYHVNGTPAPSWVDLALVRRKKTLNERRQIQHARDAQRRQAAERAEQDRKAAQKSEAEEVLPTFFETADPEVAARLSEAYRPAFVRIMKSGTTYRVEDSEGRGKQIAISVQAERAELLAQNADPDKDFAKRREEAAEVLAAR